jgi:hypothetical protein
MFHEVDHLLCKCKALNSNLSPTKKNQLSQLSSHRRKKDMPFHVANSLWPFVTCESLLGQLMGEKTKDKADTVPSLTDSIAWGRLALGKRCCVRFCHHKEIPEKIDL